ncbi:hypothetical protein SLE2022_396680 [Rubroshorea leprosula]
MQAAAALNFQILPEARQPNAANAPPPNNLRAAVHGPPGVPDKWGARRRRSARPHQPNAANAPPNNLRAAVHGPPGVPDKWGARRRRSARPQHQSVASVECGARRARSARGRLQD